jgi:hypothetical protein
MRQILSALAVLTLFFTSCKKDTEKDGVFKGPQTKVYNGKAESWIKADKKGAPEQIGITIDAAAWASLPTGADAEEQEFVIELHPKVKEVTPLNFIELDWNPHGHEPAGIYDKPHFDFHFYMVPQAEVDATTDINTITKPVPADYVPANYVAGPPVPKMGMHWIDVTSPEFAPGGTFTQTFIYGSNDGKITFYEPMITKAFIDATTQFQRNIPQPAKVQKSGYYPTKLLVVKQDGLISIVLDGFVYRQAS